MQKKSQKRVDYWLASDTNRPYDCADNRGSEKNLGRDSTK